MRPPRKLGNGRGNLYEVPPASTSHRVFRPFAEATAKAAAVLLDTVSQSLPGLVGRLAQAQPKKK